MTPAGPPQPPPGGGPQTQGTPADGPGLRLARGFFDGYVAPIVAAVAPDLRYGAALIGPGSEVLGLDTDRSTDHDFGPRVLLFLASGDHPTHRTTLERELDARLPASYEGFPTRFNHSHDPPNTPPRHHVILTTVALWSRAALGVDVTAGRLSAVDRLAIPWQRYAEATGGAVFRDDVGELTAMRATLARYPIDLWRYVLAGQWRRIAQEEAFVGRAGEVGDDTGSAVLAARLVRDLMALALLQAGRYPPYGKWFGTAFQTLPIAATIGGALDAALHATDWPRRTAALCAAYETLAAAQNELRLAEPVDPSCRPFHDRPYVVLGADRFADALAAVPVTDPEVAALPPLGCVDQFVDSTDVLADAARCRAVALAALGSPDVGSPDVGSPDATVGSPGVTVGNPGGRSEPSA